MSNIHPNVSDWIQLNEFGGLLISSCLQAGTNYNGNMKTGTQNIKAPKVNRKLILSTYGNYLKEKLVSVYNNHFPFEELSPLDHYLNEEGVSAEKDRQGNPRVNIKIKMSPLRIEVQELSSHRKQVIWQMIGA